jgi:hypothetical protein
LAKKGELTQEGIMVYEVPERGRYKYYLIEREPFEKNREKRGVFCFGSTADAVFWSRAEALAELARFPKGEAAKTPGETAPEQEEAAQAE